MVATGEGNFDMKMQDFWTLKSLNCRSFRGASPPPPLVPPPGLRPGPDWGPRRSPDPSPNFAPSNPKTLDPRLYSVLKEETGRGHTQINRGRESGKLLYNTHEYFSHWLVIIVQCWYASRTVPNFYKSSSIFELLQINLVNFGKLLRLFQFQLHTDYLIWL